MGMVPAQHSSHGVRTFAVRLVGGQVVLVHGIQDAAMHGLQPVPHIRQGTGHDDRHGVIQKAFAHFLFQHHVDDFVFAGGLFVHNETMPFW